MRVLKIITRRIQERLERGLVGTRLQELIWRTRHLYKPGWSEEYLLTIGHPHRGQIVDAVASFSPVASVMEVGCASGANLVRLRSRLPLATLTGIDINSQAIETGRRHFATLGDLRTRLLVGRANCLPNISDASVDVVVTDAVLMFVGPDRINQVIRELGRVASKGLVLNEYHLAGEVTGLFDGGRWVYDFAALIRLQFPQARVQTRRSDFVGGAWDSYGTLIEVRF